jgi:radical SAM protein with 4Fe4S-binding SPASM domain
MLNKQGKLVNPELRVETTNACQGRCMICPRDEMTRPIETMNGEHFLKLVMQAHGLGANFVSLFGFGEPLLDPGLGAKLAYCSRLALDTFITTNAQALTIAKSFELLQAGLTKIRFSAHGRGATYEKVHKGFSFSEIMRNISNFIQINNTRFEHACTTMVTVIPMHNENIDELVDFWTSLVDEVEIWRPHNWGQKLNYRVQTKKLAKTCFRPFSGPIQVQVDGTVIPCCFLTNSEIVLGDTRKNRLYEILASDAYEEFKNRHKSGDLQGLPCETCDQRFVYDKSPLLYSSVDESRELGKTSSTKFKLKEI